MLINRRGSIHDLREHSPDRGMGRKQRFVFINKHFYFINLISL